MLDINSCSLKQIKGVQGIDDKLGENFIKYRRVHGRFRSFDEIWRVPGMNRASFQILAKQFRISLPKPIILNSKLPQARLSLTKSMIDFVCKGQSVSGHDVKSPEAVPSGTTRNGTRYRIPSKEEKHAGQSKDDIPMRVKITKKSSSSLGNSKSRHSANEKPSFRPAQKSAPIEREPTRLINEARLKSASPLASYKYKVAKEQEFHHGESPPEELNFEGKDEQDPQSQNQPAITLVATPSGNNINFSCTIDKRFLKHPTSMAFHYDDKGSNEINPENQETNQLPENEALEGNDSGGNNKTLWQIPGSSAKPLNTDMSEAKTTLNDSTSTSISSPLSQENLFLFERQNTQSPVEKKSAIEAWVVEVNVSRDLEAVYKRKRSAQRKSGGAWSPNSKKTLSPPPKKLLRRPMIEQNLSSTNAKTYGRPRITQTVTRVKTDNGSRTRIRSSPTKSPTKDKTSGTPMSTPGLDKDPKEKISDSNSDAGAKALIDAQRAASIRKHIRQVEQPGRTRYGQGGWNKNGGIKFMSDGKVTNRKTETHRVHIRASQDSSHLTPRDLIKSKALQNGGNQQVGGEEEVCAVM